MKTTLLALVLATLLAACGKNGGGAAVTPSLVGTWTRSFVNGSGSTTTHVVSFATAGTCHWTTTVSDGTPVAPEDCTYTVTGDVLTITYPSATTEQERISFPDPNSVTWTAQDGSHQPIPWTRQ